jgi:hypothetical protein
MAHARGSFFNPLCGDGRRRSCKELQSLMKKWNAKCPPGTEVDIQPWFHLHRTRTTSVARILSGYAVIVGIEWGPGYVWDIQEMDLASPESCSLCLQGITAPERWYRYPDGRASHGACIDTLDGREHLELPGREAPR